MRLQVSSITVSDFIPLLVFGLSLALVSPNFTSRKQRGLYQGMANM